MHGIPGTITDPNIGRIPSDLQAARDKAKAEPPAFPADEVRLGFDAEDGKRLYHVLENARLYGLVTPEAEPVVTYVQLGIVLQAAKAQHAQEG